MKILKSEHYVMHSFTFKISSKGKYDPRFIVITTSFLYNVEMAQEKGTLLRNCYSFKKVLWWHPLEALTQIVVDQDDKTQDYVINFFFSKKEQTEIFK